MNNSIKILITCYLIALCSFSYGSFQCEESKVTQVLNIGFDYTGNTEGLSELPGVNVDRKNFQDINHGLYGKEVTSKSINDADISNAPNVKEAFLKKLRGFSRENTGGKAALNYSGHGVRCKKPGGEVTWCIALPVKELKVNKEDYFPLPESSNENVFILTENLKNSMVTVSEINDAYPSKVAMIDSCHSGEMAVEMMNIQGRNGQDSTFVLAATVGSNVAYDDAPGGRLMSALKQLVTSSDENLCKLDFNQDGQISEREALAGIFSHNAKDSLKRLGDSLYDKERLTFAGSKSSSQLAFGNPSDKCFAMPESTCPNTIPANELNLCISAQNKTKSLTKNLKTVFVELVNNDTLDFLAPSGSKKGLSRVNYDPRPLDSLCTDKENVETRPCSGLFKCSCPNGKRKIKDKTENDPNIYCAEKYDLVSKEEFRYLKRVVSCEGNECICPSGFESNKNNLPKVKGMSRVATLSCYTRLRSTRGIGVRVARLESDEVIVNKKCTDNLTPVKDLFKKGIGVRARPEHENEKPSTVSSTSANLLSPVSSDEIEEIEGNEDEEYFEKDREESLSLKQLDHYKKFFDDWKNDVSKDVNQKCSSQDTCSDNLIAPFGEVNDYIIESIKPMFHDKYTNTP